MGWTSAASWKKKGDVVKAILSECYGPSRIVVEQKSTGSGLWLLVCDSAGILRIDFFLIEKCAYKDMTESMHPYFYDCPLAFLEAAPEVCAEWREKVRAFHAAKARTFKADDRVTIFGEKYTVVGPYKRSWLVRRHKDGREFKARPQDMRPTDEGV